MKSSMLQAFVITSQKIHEIARKTLKTAQETMKRDYDSKMREVEYQPGDFVYMYVLDTAHIKGRAKKLDPPPPGKAQEL